MHLKRRTTTDGDYSSHAPLHRFRLLAGKEPTTEELLQKIDTLQRRILKKTEEVEKHELTIEDLQRQIAELQRMIDRLPGPKEAEALAAAKRAVKVGDSVELFCCCLVVFYFFCPIRK